MSRILRRRLLDRATQAGVLPRLHRRFPERMLVRASEADINAMWSWLERTVREAESVR